MLGEGGAPGAFYAAALDGEPLRAVLPDGEAVAVPVQRWLGEAGAADRAILARAVGPVLDVGCGPGRHVAHLAARGVLALGIDSSRAAVRRAQERGAATVCCDVFGPVPGAGAWRTALVLDGNVGIGGDPVALLARVGELVAPGGRVLVELATPGRPSGRSQVRLACADARSAPLPWATLAADRVHSVAALAGLRVADVRCLDGRWFTELRR